MKNLRHIMQTFFPPNAYGWIFLLFGILLLPNLIGIIFLSDLQGSLLLKIAYLGFACLLWVTPTFFLRMRTYFWVMSVFMLLAPLEIAHILLNRMPVTEGFLTAIRHTNHQEAIELLQSLLPAVFGFLLLWVAYFLTLILKIKNNYLFPRKARFTGLILIILANLLLFGTMYRMAVKGSLSLSDPVEIAWDHFAKKYRKIYPCNLLTVTARMYFNEHAIGNMQKELADFTFGAAHRPTGEREIYVVVIGESARYGNFSVNGYARPTSPRLEKIDGLLSFSDVQATANLTEPALSLLLTRATPHDPHIAYAEKSFVDAFSEAGFHTAWIANQSSQNRFVRRIANEVDLSRFSLTDFDASTNYDGLLLPYIEDLLDERNKQQFIVVHTLGSHFRYNFRYPERYTYFTLSLQGAMGYSVLSPAHKELLVNTYDNAIRYTDYVLSSIIRLVEEEDAVSSVIYISDHAENLYDDENNLILHGGTRYSRYETHVPLFIWTSEKYNERYVGKREQLEENVNKKAGANNLFHTLLDIADIRYLGEQPEKSLASPRFKEEAERYILMPDNRVVTIKD